MRAKPDRRTAAATAYRSWYKTAAWAAIRLRRLAAEPVCRMCGHVGRVTVATICDHVIPHKGDRALFFSFDNTQSLCKRCHDGTKQAEERRGYVIGSDVDGRPLDPSHPWNTR